MMVRWVLGGAILAVTVSVAARHREPLLEALRLMAEVPPWVGPVVAAAVGASYLSRGCAYRVALRTLGYKLHLWVLTGAAVAATTAHHLVPSGGASGYALITYVLHRRGIPGGQASVLALVDTLSNAAALGSLVLAVMLYLAFSPSDQGWPFTSGILPGTILLGVVGTIYWLQRSRRRLARAQQGVQRLIERASGRTFSGVAVQRFLDQYSEGKRLIGAAPLRFLYMVGWQYGAVACQCAALWVIFHALGLVPEAWIIFSGLVVAMGGVSLVPAPAGGGSFELVMSGFFVYYGVDAPDSVAAALLYRLGSFWLPALLTVPVLYRLRNRPTICR